MIEALRHAGSEAAVHGFAAHIGDYGNESLVSNLADIQELRDAIFHFR